MTEKFYKEVEACNAEIEKSKLNQSENPVFDAIKKSYILHLTCSKWGIEGLERYSSYLEKGSLFHDMVEQYREYVSRQKELEEKLLARYILSDLTGEEGLYYLILVYAVCSEEWEFCFGYAPKFKYDRALLDKILSLLPVKWREDERVEKLREVSECTDIREVKVENLKESGYIPLLDRNQYFAVTMMEMILPTICNPNLEKIYAHEVKDKMKGMQKVSVGEMADVIEGFFYKFMQFVYEQDKESGLIYYDYLEKIRPWRVKVEEGKFPLFKIVDEAVLKLEPSMRLRLMREFSSEELAVILRVVGDESAEIILRSLSVRLVNMILSCVESYGEVSPENIEKLLKNSVTRRILYVLDEKGDE